MSQVRIVEKKFEYNLSNIPQKNGILPAGKYKDDELEIEIQIAPDQINNLNFKFTFLKYPQSIPFWAIITVRIQEKKNKFFINEKKNGDQFNISFPSSFRKGILQKGDVTIFYKIVHLPTFICKLENINECVCYMNSSIQLLFRLTKFRNLLFSPSVRNKNFWISQLYSLFTKMCSCKTSVTTDKLTQSFGWPPIARRLTQDSTEFIEKLLENFSENLTDAKSKQIFNEIFELRSIDKALSNDTSSSFQSRYVLNLSESISGSLEERIKEEMQNTKILRFPEVLFISVMEFSALKNNLPRSLDMAKITDTENLQHSKYTLSGLIIYYQAKEGTNSISHYTSAVRASKEEVWQYFTDNSQTTYGWSYDPYLQTIKTPLDSEIKQLIGKKFIRVFMYIADDVLKSYYCYYIPRKIASSDMLPARKKSYYQGETRLFLITTPRDVDDYVKSGHTDFRNVRSSIEFALPSNSPYSSVYRKVSELMKVPIESFILKSEESTSGEPAALTLKNNNIDTISNFGVYKVHLFFTEFVVDEASLKSPFGLRLSFNKFIPFYFLSFKFNPKSFIHNLTSNLTHTNRRNQIQRAASDSASKKLKESENDSINQKNGLVLERMCYHYLTNLALSYDGKFKTVIPQLLKILNKPEGTNIRLYTANYENSRKVGYKEFNVELTIKDCIHQNMNGIYVYVQCADDFIDDKSSSSSSLTNNNDNDNNNNNDNDNDNNNNNDNDNNINNANYITLKSDELMLMDEQIKSKFLFFKYYEKALKKHVYPKEIPIVFTMENYSIPVTFRKLSDPKKKSKTMIFPFKFPLKNLVELKRIICAAMDEEYPENGLMQLFLGFRKGAPPFNDSASSHLSIQKVSRVLESMLNNTKTELRSLGCFTPKSNDSLSEMDSDSDPDYNSNISIHYHIFNTYDKNNQVSIRVYFSEDSISIKCYTQLLINKGTKVSDIANNIINIFSQQLSDKDKENLINIIQNNLVFTDFYHIIETCDGKISRQFKYDYSLSYDTEIRFERIQDYCKSDELKGLIPVFYGAKYNNTKYIATFGTPFYFPVFNDDLDNLEAKNKVLFQDSKPFLRLKQMIRDIKKGERFAYYVVNYSGLIQNVHVGDFKTIIEKQLNIIICIKNINASIFIDEIRFFENGIKILQ